MGDEGGFAPNVQDNNEAQHAGWMNRGGVSTRHLLVTSVHLGG